MNAHFGAILVLVAAVLGWSGWSRAADEASTMRVVAEERADDVASSPDSPISREDWKQRIGQARAGRAGATGLAAKCAAAHDRAGSAGKDSYRAFAE
ncbi:hypothetical protein [Bradyrhizobium sp. I71]|uniref:hypothetical protein n=1 Tax=Bradyrhizobium sp. I71 TaxID=2590772 RepID=UPI001EF7A8C8|nr:hypothetical protein [Bradyrhizobium sp. I71]ULK95927.1 hypothetical protein FJV43_24595 [Bradyrhizobium sp. I71]